MSKGRVTHFRQLSLVKVKKTLRKSQARFGKLGNLRLKQNDGFLIKNVKLFCSHGRSFRLLKGV